MSWLRIAPDQRRCITAELLPLERARQPVPDGSNGGVAGSRPLPALPWVEMPTLDAAHRLAADAMTVADASALRDILAEACARLGCSWFALTHHVDFLAAPGKGVRIHNYPDDWARWFDERGLGLSDPVHRASQRRAAGFLWHDMTKFSAPRAGDNDILERARRHDIWNGLTIPAHLPGEAHGSVSFAWTRGGDASAEALTFAQTIGGFVFEAARQLSGPVAETLRPRLTDRQAECVLWVARGKSDAAIAQILALSPETVSEHLRNARARYDALSRTTLAIRALFDGTISFGDVAEG